MKIGRYIALAAIGVGAIAPAHAATATLDYSIASDNAFAIYLSPSDSTIGSLVATNLFGPAGQWNTAVTGSVIFNSSEYLQIIGFNYTSSNGQWNTPGTGPGATGDNPAAVLGSFTLTGGTFSNGGTSLLTNATNWASIAVAPPIPDDPSAFPANPGWTPPTGTPLSDGANGISPWGTVGGIPSNADWIWAQDGSPYEYADFSTLLTVPNGDETPLPGTLPLVASGLGVLGLFGWRRRRQAAASLRLA